MAVWNPWKGCHRCSEGCKYCYIHKGRARRGESRDAVIPSKSFDAPLKRDKNGGYKIKSGERVFLCFSSDFLLEDADPWRPRCWEAIRARPDLDFLFLTKRITRFMNCIPPDWGAGYHNVTVGCTVENQQNADEKLAFFSRLPIKHKNIILQPLIGPVNIAPYLDGVELVVLGGESDKNARPLNYDWVLDVRRQCEDSCVSFEFRQCGTHFVKDGKRYTIPTKYLCSQARKANIDLHF